MSLFLVDSVNALRVLAESRVLERFLGHASGKAFWEVFGFCEGKASVSGVGLVGGGGSSGGGLGCGSWLEEGVCAERILFVFGEGLWLGGEPVLGFLGLVGAGAGGGVDAVADLLVFGDVWVHDEVEVVDFFSFVVHFKFKIVC